MQKPQFENGQIYHIYNRGVEKRNVFMDDGDHLRFIDDLIEFNDTYPVLPSNIRFSAKSKSSEIQPRRIRKKVLLVEILAFCLMPNHYHLLVRQKTDGGIIAFMQKLGTGYTMYFNIKNERVGSLFQGRFKAVLVENDNHLLYLPHYINPLDIRMADWREGKIKSSARAMKFLENYRWSSFLDYIGKNNFPMVTQRKFLIDIFGSTSEYKKNIQEWLEDMDLDSVSSVTMDC